MVSSHKRIGLRKESQSS